MFVAVFQPRFALPFVFLVLAVARLFADLAPVDAGPADVAKELVGLVAELAADLNKF